MSDFLSRLDQAVRTLRDVKEIIAETHHAYQYLDFLPPEYGQASFAIYHWSDDDFKPLKVADQLLAEFMRLKSIIGRSNGKFDANASKAFASERPNADMNARAYDFNRRENGGNGRNECSTASNEGSMCLWHSRMAHFHVKSLKRLAQDKDVFGAKCFVHHTAPGQGKLEDRAWVGVLVGYAFGTRGYRVWDPATDRVVQTKHVKIDETIVYKHFGSQQCRTLARMHEIQRQVSMRSREKLEQNDAIASWQQNNSLTQT
uniref:Retroviral polymerase SH3-like domain-containing protein n=1 Tax=Strigamia maritima TaxID=126957 RepID=T1IME9_STRMM